MGIIFNINDNKLNNSFLREFEADGVSSEDEDDDYSVDNNDDEDGEEGTDAVEADNDPAPQSEEEQEDTSDEEDDDYTMDGDDESSGEDNEEGDTEEDNDTGDENEDPQEEDEGGEEDDDYTLDGDDDEDSEEGGEEAQDSEDDDDYTMDGDDDSSGEEGGEEDKPANKLKELEGELFETLSPEQQQIKIDELKKCFQELYERCDGIIEIINNSNPPDENVSKIFEYVNDNMSDLKQYIYDYFTYTFGTKSYQENSAQYQKYIATLNSFNSILEELVKNKEKESK